MRCAFPAQTLQSSAVSALSHPSAFTDVSMTTQPHRLAQLCRHKPSAAPGTFPGPTVRIPQVSGAHSQHSPLETVGEVGKVGDLRSVTHSDLKQSEPCALTLIFLRDRNLFLLQRGKETAAQSGSTGETTKARGPDQSCATKLACQPLPPGPGNTRATPGHTAAHRQA